MKCQVKINVLRCIEAKKAHDGWIIKFATFLGFVYSLYVKELYYFDDDANPWIKVDVRTKTENFSTLFLSRPPIGYGLEHVVVSNASVREKLVDVPESNFPYQKV